MFRSIRLSFVLTQTLFILVVNNNGCFIQKFKLLRTLNIIINWWKYLIFAKHWPVHLRTLYIRELKKTQVFCFTNDLIEKRNFHYFCVFFFFTKFNVYFYFIIEHTTHLQKNKWQQTSSHSFVLKETLLKADGPWTNQLRRRHHWLIEEPLEWQGSRLGKRVPVVTFRGVTFHLEWA